MIPEIFQYEFMQKAFAAGLLSGMSCSLVGVLVVTMRISTVGICISHAGFAGALFGLLVDLNYLATAFVFSLVAAGVVGPLADRAEFAPETSVGILFSAMLGLAFLFIGLMPGSRTSALDLFWGSILTVTRGDLLLLAIIAAILLILLLMFFKEVQAVLCHRSVALAVGIPAGAVFYGMLILLGATVTASLKSVGGLLIYSLIINPAAAAYQVTYCLRKLFFFSALFGVLVCWGGLFISYVLDIPSGAAIVLLSTLLVAALTLYSPKKRGAMTGWTGTDQRD